ncbi:oocyte zinc finger protein XlCOF6-like [Neocloeon triangulifer]|uniref:oocyte zinc finger protein XlCOF6-like n=1 Tax=Neocloeon triangulifer TaxID=2078957 RepID=UPI00286ECBC5|nr:oocyte zinc finger protein XlCOF6-like [Neocloeon triangulifer]XP_059470504.1 oocyte zinc finger protein XlCOF6-like [Neocloeon triangulifer]
MVDYALEVSFMDLCRVCANPCTKSRRIQFFGADGTRLKLIEKISNHLSLLIEENDGYPDFACVLCASKISICDSLYNISKEANERLRALKTQLEYEKKNPDISTEQECESADENMLDATYANQNIMEMRSDIDTEIKGSYEMIPDADNSRITVILPKGDPFIKKETEQSLVLVNVPIGNDGIQKSKGLNMSGKHEQSAIERVIKSNIDVEITKSLNSLSSAKSESEADGVRRSSRSRTQKRFYEIDKTEEQEGHTCTVCNMTFSTLKKLHMHKKSRSHDVKACAKSLMCEKCRKTFGSADDLKSHNCSPLVCYFCNSWFANTKEQEQHQSLHDGPYICDMCGATFSNLEVLQYHILWHTSGKGRKRLYQCKVCGRLFKSRFGLKGHESSHTDQRLYSCYICNTSFRNKDEMLLHRNQHTKEEKEHKLGETPRKKNLQTCEVCKKVLGSKASLKVHMRIHRGEKPFECSECGKHFRQEIKLRYHLRLHMGELPYACTTCGKRFNTQRQLDTHTRMHTNERPYICEVCGLGFRSIGVLGRHKNTHSEEPLFACSFCGKKFRTRHATTTHERTHTGDKRVICDLCGRTFAHKSTLDKHRRRHEKQLVYCLDCNISFSSKKELRRHFQKKHSVTLVAPVFEAVRNSEFVSLSVPNDDLIVEVVV